VLNSKCDVNVRVQGRQNQSTCFELVVRTYLNHELNQPFVSAEASRTFLSNLLAAALTSLPASARLWSNLALPSSSFFCASCE
jgi:hypothetical protein